MDSDLNISLQSITLTTGSQDLLAFALNIPTTYLIQWEGFSKAYSMGFLPQVITGLATIG